MHNTKDEANECSALLREVCEHYSHSLRTPLGVAMGVVNDLADGYEVSKDELEDARSALGSILVLLNELRDVPKKAREEKE